MLNVHDLSVSFQGETLFENVSFMLNQGDKVGLIGKNGAGKSTMLKLLSKELTPDGGVIALEKDAKVGMLKQDIDFEGGKTVLEHTYQAFKQVQEVEKKIEEINQRLESIKNYNSQQYHKAIEELHEQTHRYEIVGGHTFKAETEKVLLGLGFKREDFDRPTESFSGGWRMRIELSKLLLEKNEVLLLDEPTNHLDIDSIVWLENFLKNYSGAVVLVSHDRVFLDNVTNRTIEIVAGRIYDYSKPYTKYMEFRKELIEQQLSAQKNQEKKIEQTQALIDKFRAKASKASMAQSLIKKLDKIEKIQVDVTDDSVMNVSFPVSVQPGKVVVTIDRASKNYGEKQVLNEIDLIVERGSKIAFVGQNGQGKTTLAKMIVGEVPYKGEITLGHNVQIGYFAQNQAQYLDAEKTLEEVMEEAANDANRSKIRDILGAFLFSAEQVEKKVKVLSGGERNRLALAKLLLSSFNVLVMDEPTNHLDIKSKMVLKQALEKFQGTLIVVSHDRDFLQGLTQKVYEFKDGKIKEYLGDVNFFLEQKQAQNFREIEKKNQEKEQKKEEKISYKDKKQQKTIQNKVSKIESVITQLEEEIKQMEKQMYQNPDVATEDFLQNYQIKKQEITKCMQQWEELLSSI